MSETIKYRGKQFEERELQVIQAVVAEMKNGSRWGISREICRRLDWRQSNGALKDMICRSLLLRLEEQGLLQLPPSKMESPYFKYGQRAPQRMEWDQEPLVKPLAELHPIELLCVRGTELAETYKSMMAEHHYLGYTRPVGEHLEYLARWKTRVLGGLGWSSAPRHIGCRDRHLGWGLAERRRNLAGVAVNTRFLILPRVRVPHLASHVLGRQARQLPRDWRRWFGHGLAWLETFVDAERGFRGTCYRAANWLRLGQTTGRGKNDRTNRANRSRKDVYGYPVRPDFREALHHGLL